MTGGWIGAAAPPSRWHGSVLCAILPRLVGEGFMSRNSALFAACLGIVLMAPQPATAQELSSEGQLVGSKIAIRELKRDAEATMTLRFQLINEGDQRIKTYGVLGELFTLDKVTLVDTANKKKYLVVKDSEGVCVCSELKDDAEPGTQFNLWAKFPAPPDTVQKITVIVPGFEPIEAVPIAAP